MWNKVSLRMKITILTTFALSLVIACITWLSIYNAQQHIVTPFTTLHITATEGLFDSPNFIIYDIVMLSQQWSPELTQAASQQYINTSQFAIDEYQHNFQTHSLIIAVTFILIGAVGAYLISGQALKPIKSLAERIENIDANNLATQIEPPESNDEISRLTNSFNNMLKKLNLSFETQKLFAQNAAHELKTPLASIRANIEVLQLDNEPSEDEYKEVVGTVKDSTEQLILLVEGLLSLNDNIDKSKWQFFCGKEMFKKILDELQEDITSKNLTVSLSGECHIKGDKALLERAFSNLVHNAIRYNIENGEIKINLADDSIIIEDNGIGISAENLVHIFEPFYCVDSSRSKKLGGNGLGLAIAKHIFDKHKMAISISSEPGKGTTIILYKC